jgi:hypothetical protein
MTSPLLTPPRPTDLDSRETQASDPEALIKEARRRARHRRAAYAGAALIAVGAALGAFFVFRGDGTSPPSRPEAGGPPRGLPAAATIKGTLPFLLRGTVLFSARAGSLFVLAISPDQARSIAVERVGPDGATTKKRLSFDQPAFLMNLSIGPDGLYAGTAVVKRFTSRPDELIRIDPQTLTIRARASFPASVASVEQGGRMWAAIGDGRVVRLDPRTLAIEASQRVLPAAATANESATLSKPAFGLASVWVLAGDALNLQLVRMDPTSLAVRSRTRVPTGGQLAQALNHLAADSSHVYLVGSALAAVGANGKLLGRPVVVPGLANAAIHGSGLVGLTADQPSVVLLGARGRIEAKTGVLDAGADLAVSGEDAWFLGNAGHGNGIVHVRLATR